VTRLRERSQRFIRVYFDLLVGSHLPLSRRGFGDSKNSQLKISSSPRLCNHPFCFLPLQVQTRYLTLRLRDVVLSEIYSEIMLFYPVIGFDYGILSSLLPQSFFGKSLINCTSVAWCADAFRDRDASLDCTFILDPHRDPHRIPRW
jgi:hypothetical protein